MPKDRSLIGAWLDLELAEKIRDIAYWERLTLSEVVGEGLRKHVEEIERLRGDPYPPRPATRRQPEDASAETTPNDAEAEAASSTAAHPGDHGPEGPH